jgi:hypothetical protein
MPLSDSRTKAPPVAGFGNGGGKVRRMLVAA